MKKKIKPSALTLTPRLHYEAYAREYERELRKFIRAMFKSVKYHVRAALKRVDMATQDASPIHTPVHLKQTLSALFKDWEDKTKNAGKKLTARQLRRLYRYVSGKYSPFKGKKAGINSARMKEAIKARYEANYGLIVSLPQQVKTKMETVLYNAITGGNEEEIFKRLQEIEDTTEYQCTRIARDQSAKAAEAFNIAEAQELGIEYYVWQTCQDERVSTGKGGHDKLNGLIFKYGQPEAIIDTKGHKGIPGERPNCRCTSLGVFLQPGEKIQRAKNGYGYEVVRV